MKTKKTEGLFSSLPQKAKVLGAKFIHAGGKQFFSISYLHNGQTITQSIQTKGGAV
ncbi:hypothetical protein M2132_001834 [Dysgonomonas sp. PH5-45]|uniref:hypothetical protein n=1 Tax=unclassified Dysgonomonas TaxID=2630389 RepID=UPI002475D7F1|nr:MULTISPECIES: hypothetical protein [unclassified Dysgonomonas]MDH6355491.1 hypothetical protein [Dysgonomonas sp. PH5-45]MDH6388387.1 hypothetical protein [Dysgonomonas sp. PH5-37]